MKIVRLLSVACALSLLAACGSENVTGSNPDASSARRENEASGGGLFGSGN